VRQAAYPYYTVILSVSEGSPDFERRGFFNRYRGFRMTVGERGFFNR